MSSGFAGGVTALVWSRFPDRTNREIRQILRNTARKSAGRDDWDPELGWGVLDAHRAVPLSEDQLCHSLETGTEEAAAKRDQLGDRGLVVGNI
ncbi:MAG: S8 family serine peptidase [Spirochaetia bacterium]